MSDYDFKMIYDYDAIVTSFIPVEEEHRDLFYNFMLLEGIQLPLYETIERSNMRKQDLNVLVFGITVKFNYNGKGYRILLKPGYVTDGASVPVGLVNGDLNKFGQAIQLAAMVHDLLFNKKLVSFDDANNIFEGILRNTGLVGNATEWLYLFGVRSIVGKHSYRDNVPETSWMKDYYEFFVGDVYE